MPENRPRKSLGQHFLQDKNIAMKIVAALPDDATSTVMEIGPGRGVLTEFLYERFGKDLYLVELDQDLAQNLKNEYSGLDKRILNIDFLQVKQDFFSESVRIIGNLPYNISSQIFFKVLEYKDHIPYVVCMIQKEVAERIASKYGSKSYGILSVLIQAYYNTEYLFTVSPKVFYPQPKVKSAVIRLSLKKDLPDCDFDLFRKIVKAAFNQRRKMLRNSLKSFGVDTHGDIEHMLQYRPEQLKVSDFIFIANCLSREN